MRNLKFRIWDGNNGCFVYPELIELNAGLEYQQFTGLFDRRGREIYEGDIVEYVPWALAGNMERRAVEFKDGIYYAGYQLKDVNDGEVIGNVHKNPELLEGGGGMMVTLGEIGYEKVINFLKQNGVKPRELKSVIDVAQKCDVAPEELFDLLVVIKDLSRS